MAGSCQSIHQATWFGHWADCSLLQHFTLWLCHLKADINFNITVGHLTPGSLWPAVSNCEYLISRAHSVFLKVMIRCVINDNFFILCEFITALLILFIWFCAGKCYLHSIFCWRFHFCWKGIIFVICRQKTCMWHTVYPVNGYIKWSYWLWQLFAYFSLHPPCCIHTSSFVTLACLEASSSLKITNRSFRHASYFLFHFVSLVITNLLHLCHLH